MTATSSVGDEQVELPSRLYLDTQFCFAYIVDSDRDHQAAEALAVVLKQLATAKLVTCYFSILAVDELAWKLAGFIYDRDNGLHSWRAAADKASAFRSVKIEVADCIGDFMREPWVSVLRVPDSAYPRVCQFMRQHDLKPADLCHLTLAHAASAGLVSNDADFARLASPPVEIVNY